MFTFFPLFESLSIKMDRLKIVREKLIIILHLARFPHFCVNSISERAYKMFYNFSFVLRFGFFILKIYQH